MGKVIFKFNKWWIVSRIKCSQPCNEFINCKCYNPIEIHPNDQNLIKYSKFEDVEYPVNFQFEIVEEQTGSRVVKSNGILVDFHSYFTTYAKINTIVYDDDKQGSIWFEIFRLLKINVSSDKMLQLIKDYKIIKINEDNK